MTRPVVLIAEELSPATVEALGPDFDIRHTDGANRVELLAALPGAHAVLVRSATHMDAEALAPEKGSKERVLNPSRCGFISWEGHHTVSSTKIGVFATKVLAGMPRVSTSRPQRLSSGVQPVKFRSKGMQFFCWCFA